MRKILIPMLTIIFVLAIATATIFCSEMFVGTLTGTGADMNVSLGFKPSYVRVVNISNSTTKGTAIEWVYGMTADTAIFINSVSPGGVWAVNGISRYAGTTTAAPGFSIGSSGNKVNTLNDTLMYIAVP